MLERLLREIPEFRLRIDEHRLEFSQATVDHYKTLDISGPVVLGVESAWMKFTCREYRHLGWFLALGDWDYRLSGWMAIRPQSAEESREVVAILRVSLRDYYDWDCGPTTKVGSISIPNSIPARLHSAAMAREFTMYGESTMINIVRLPLKG